MRFTARQWSRVMREAARRKPDARSLTRAEYSAFLASIATELYPYSQKDSRHD